MANIKKIKIVHGGLGGAKPEQVLAGVSFSSQSGVHQIGTMNPIAPADPITGLYCWKKYILLDDINKEFVNFVVSDNETEYPDNEALDGYYYEMISQEELAQLMADTEAGSYLVSNIESVQRVDEDTISLQISI